MSDERDEGPFHRNRKGAGGLEFSVEAIERLELVGRLMTTERIAFEASQLVKPRPFAPLVFKGAYVVMEVLAEPIRYPVNNRDVDGFLFDLRVGYACDAGHIHSMLAESWMFEPYTGLVMFGTTVTERPKPGIV